MRTLTKAEALELTAKQWEWLAENTGRGKWEYDYSGDSPPENCCYCCEYAEQQDGGVGDGTCSACPLLTRWTGKAEHGACEQPTSPYKRWRAGGHEAKYALQIAKMAREELEKLGVCSACGQELPEEPEPTPEPRKIVRCNNCGTKISMSREQYESLREAHRVANKALKKAGVARVHSPNPLVFLDLSDCCGDADY